MADFDPERDPIEQLAEEFVEKYRHGERPSVHAYAQQYPNLADQILALLPHVARMEELKYLKQAARAAVPEPPPAWHPGAQLGDYRLVREMGRGGMGIVYEAEQKSLGRRVALKVLPRQSLLDPRQVERFEREARAAAQLHHTNIVPVFGVGEQDGVHYYVMQLIGGLSLQQLLAEMKRGSAFPEERKGNSGPQSGDTVDGSVGAGTRPSYCSSHWQRLARLGMQVANALQYAHEQGTLHRDIKPANLLLDDHGTVWVTDFGLAKLNDQDRLTHTGDLVGTLHYMAPEALQARGDARSDVYSLGATLYELLTLEPPFNEPNPARLIQHIGEGEPPRPRQRNPHIPRDLETIVLKALAREPEQRYQTAGTLAEDLQRFLNDQPIQARRATPLSRLWRWCRRNRAVSSLTALASAAMLLAAVVGWVGYVNTREALARESRKRDEAEAATKRVEDNLALSLQAFEEVFNAIPQHDPGPVGRPPGPPLGMMRPTGDSEEDIVLLQSILSFYDRFAEQNATNPQLQLEAAKAYRRVGLLHQRLERLEKAEAAQRRALTAFEQLAEAFPEVPDYQCEVVETYVSFAIDPGDKKKLQELDSLFREALEKTARLADDHPAVPRYVSAVSRLEGKLATVLLHLGRLTEAEATYRQAVSRLKLLLEQVGSSSSAVLELARARQALADCLNRNEQPAEARKVLETSIGELETLTAKGPRFGRSYGPFATPESLLAFQYESLAQILQKLGEKTQAAEAARKGRELRRHWDHRPGPGRNPPPRETRPS